MIKTFGKYVENGFLFTIFFISLPIMLYALLDVNLSNDYSEYMQLGTDISKHKFYVNILIHITFTILIIYSLFLQFAIYIVRENKIYYDENDFLIISGRINKFIIGLIFLEITYFLYLV